MYLGAFFEVSLDLSLLWFFLSTAVMHLQEWLASILKLRAKELENSIRNILRDDALTDLFYDHPVIRGLGGVENGKPRRPSYLPSGQFASVISSIISDSDNESQIILLGLYKLRRNLFLVKKKKQREIAAKRLEHLIEMARTAVANHASQIYGDLLTTTLQKEVEKFGTSFSELENEVLSILSKAQEIMEKVEKSLDIHKASESLNGKELESIASGMLALSLLSPDLKLTLSNWFVRNGSNQKASEAIEFNIANWFDDAMDRVTGVYKRKIQFVTLLIGFFLACSLNIDTVHVASSLWDRAMVRELLAADASMLVGSGSESSQITSEEVTRVFYRYLTNAEIPIGWRGTWILNSKNGVCIDQDGSIGVGVFGLCFLSDELTPDLNLTWWFVLKFLGFFISAIAASQGSSFWFDILSKIVNIRSTGGRPAGINDNLSLISAP